MLQGYRIFEALFLFYTRNFLSNEKCSAEYVYALCFLSTDRKLWYNRYIIED